MTRATAQRATPVDIAAIGHDPDAFEAFYRDHVEAVQRFVARRVGDRELAADLTADVFVAAIESAGSYSPQRGTPTGWLFGVARVVVCAQRRRSSREWDATQRLLGRTLLDYDDLARIDARLDAESHSRRLHAAVHELPSRLRAVLELVAVDGLSVAEAAAALGISPLAARVRLHRARGQLSGRLATAGLTTESPLISRPDPKEASL